MADSKKKSVEKIPALDFWAKHSKKIINISVLIILAVACWYGYKKFVSEPNEKKALEAMSRAQSYFGKDSFNLALNGDGPNAGFLKIIKKYPGTEAANLAHLYTGIIYLHKDDFNNAIKYLKPYETSSTLYQSTAWKMMGHAYMSLGKKQDGINYYLKAGKLNPKDEYTSSECLFLAGLAYETIGKNKEAGETYLIIREKYPKTEKGAQIDKYLARLGIIKND